MVSVENIKTSDEISVMIWKEIQIGPTVFKVKKTFALGDPKTIQIVDGQKHWPILIKQKFLLLGHLFTDQFDILNNSLYSTNQNDWSKS